MIDWSHFFTLYFPLTNLTVRTLFSIGLCTFRNQWRRYSTYCLLCCLRLIHDLALIAFVTRYQLAFSRMKFGCLECVFWSSMQVMIQRSILKICRNKPVFTFLVLNFFLMFNILFLLRPTEMWLDFLVREFPLCRPFAYLSTCSYLLRYYSSYTLNPHHAKSLNPTLISFYSFQISNFNFYTFNKS